MHTKRDEFPNETFIIGNNNNIYSVLTTTTKKPVNNFLAARSPGILYTVRHTAIYIYVLNIIRAYIFERVSRNRTFPIQNTIMIYGADEWRWESRDVRVVYYNILCKNRRLKRSVAIPADSIRKYSKIYYNNNCNNNIVIIWRTYGRDRLEDGENAKKII